MLAYMRRLFATRGHLAYLGLAFPQSWMYILSSGMVCAESAFQVAFHGGMLVCLFVLALVGYLRHANPLPIGCDIACAAPMVALPLAALLSWPVADAWVVALGILAGVGMGWCFSSWFNILCQVPLRDAFCYVLLGFSLGALGCLALRVLADIWALLSPIVGAALPAASAWAVRVCLHMGADMRSQVPGAAKQGLTAAKMVVLVVQIVVYALVFGNGFVFGVLQDSIHAFDYSAGITVLNYGLRAFLPLVLMVWLIVQASDDSTTYQPVFKVLMLMGVFVLLGVWFIGGFDTLVSYALVSTARSMVLMLLFLTCLKLTAVSGRSPWFVYGVGRGAYELSVIAGIVGYAWLTRAVGSVSIGPDLVYLTALCVLAFLTSCFFATAQSLGESDGRSASSLAPVGGAGNHEDLRLRYGLNDREFEILMLFYRGNSKRRIAEQIGISENTVRWYLQQLYARMGIHSRDELLELVNARE